MREDYRVPLTEGRASFPTMRLTAAVLVPGLLILAGCGAAQHTGSGRYEEVKVTRAVLYQNGIGYFERRGRIHGNLITLRIRPDQIADILKSLTVVDLARGRAVSVALPVEKSRARQLAELPEQVKAQGGILAVAHAFRGARATVTGAEGSASGRLVGVERIETGAGRDGTPSYEWRLTVLAAGGDLRTFAVSKVRSLRLLDKSLELGLERSLDVALNEGSWKPIDLQVRLTGPAPHDIVVSYVVEMPVWKPAYRVLVQPGGKALVQSWAVVDNVSGEDWKDVKLSLTAGTPLAFTYDLYTPRYVARPDLSPSQDQIMAGNSYPTTEGGEYYDSPADDEYGGDGAYDKSPRPAAPPAATRSGGGYGGGMGRGPATTTPRYNDRKVTAEDLQRNFQTLVAGTGVGSLFRYDIQAPVTVEDRRSALVSIVNAMVPGEDVMLFRVGVDSSSPYRAVRLKNDTGFVLEAGPVAIYRDQTFLGEALSGRLEEKAHVFVPYALDTRVRVSLDEQTDEQGLRLVSIVNGVITAETKGVTRYVYEVDNRAPEASTLYVQRARRTGWKIIKVTADDKPASAADIIEEKGVYYIPLKVPGNGKTRVVVEEETPTQRQVNFFSDLGRRVTALYLEGPNRDPKLAKQMQEATTIQDELGQLEQQINTLAENRRVLGERQNEVRQNIAELRKFKGNDDLLGKLTKTLTELEDQLNDATRKHVQATTRRTELRDRLATLFRSMTL